MAHCPVAAALREELLELLEYQGKVARARGQEPAHVDAYGDGEALASVQAKAAAAGLALTFHAKRDHLNPSLADYQVRGCAGCGSTLRRPWKQHPPLWTLQSIAHLTSVILCLHFEGCCADQTVKVVVGLRDPEC